MKISAISPPVSPGNTKRNVERTAPGGYGSQLTDENKERQPSLIFKTRLRHFLTHDRASGGMARTGRERGKLPQKTARSHGNGHNTSLV